MEKKNIYYICAIYTALFLMLLTIGLSPTFFTSYFDIPLGFILGGGVSVIFYLITEKLEETKADKYRWVLVLNVLRLVTFVSLLILIGLCYYKWEIKLFNLFSYAGGYLMSTIILITLYLTLKEKRSIE